MPENVWLEEIKQWSVSAAQDSATFDARKLGELSLSPEAEDEMFRNPLSELARWLDEYSEMRYWLAASLDDEQGVGAFRSGDLIAHRIGESKLAQDL